MIGRTGGPIPPVVRFRTGGGWEGPQATQKVPKRFRFPGSPADLTLWTESATAGRDGPKAFHTPFDRGHCGPPAPMNILDELRLRRWARENYVPAAERPADWDPIVLDEMLARDGELAANAASPVAGLVPLEPITYFVDAPHLGPASPHFLSKRATESIADAADWGMYFG